MKPEDVEKAIRETLVISNPESIYRAVNKIMALAAGSKENLHTESLKSHQDK